MDVEIYKFIKKLPTRDRSFYLLMRAYEIHIDHIANSGSKGKFDLLNSLFQDEITNLLASPCYEKINRQDNQSDNAKKSESQIPELKSAMPEIERIEIESYHIRSNDKYKQSPINISNNVKPEVPLDILPTMNKDSEQIPVKSVDDDPFAATLGKWASSFSSDDDSSDSSFDLSSH